jgi:hypothetical protein
MLRHLARTELDFTGKGISKRFPPDRAELRLFHPGTYVPIPNSAKAADAIFGYFLARNR